MSILLADIDATCAALGYFDGDKYHAEPDAIQGLKHLIWILRRDIDNHEYRRHLGRAKVLQTDLVPMLPDHIDDADYSDVLIRLLVILTNPTLLLYRDGLPKDGAGRRIYMELVDILQGYKSAFTDGRSWAALTTKLHKALETEWNVRSEEQGILIERILVLVRNVLQVPANPELECRADNDASLHDQVIWALQQSGMLDLVLYILSSADENQYHLHALEIVCLMFREQNAETLADASLQRSAAEKHRDEEELIAVRKREKQKVVARPPPARHSRFGGTYVMQNVKSISDRDVICHQSLERAVSLDFDREKTILKKSNRIVKEATKTERRSAFSVRLCLREYCIEVLRSAYNTLVRQVRRVLERSSAGASGSHDDSYLLWAIRFFLEFNRLSGMQLELVSESLSVQCFHWVLTRIQHDMDMIMMDKKQAQLWGRRLHVGIQTFRELLMSLIALKRLPDEKAQALFNMLQNNICYVLEYRETILHLLITFNENYCTKSYLRDIIETAHIFLKLMEKFCKAPVLVQEKRRGRKKGGSKPQKKKPQESTEETNDELEDMWTNFVTELVALLAQPEINIPEEKRPIPFDATSDKAIDDQKEDCMLRIYKLLREENLEECVLLMRAAREVWPEDDCFGAMSAAPEDELMLLREIFFSKLGPVEKPPQEDAEQGDQYSDEENEEEEEEEPETVERDFKFEDFAKRLLNPKIIRACTIALADWETMPTKSLKAAVTLLYRVAFELKCVAMLYQATLFKIFQKVFNTPRDKHNDELRKLAIYVIRQFVETAPKNPKIFAELLFYKTLKEANDLENGYTDTYHGSTKGAWTEEQETELRLLFEENQNNPQTDQDVIDWILDNLIDKTRTRHGILKKLKEMNLMFKAPTKKSTAAAAQKHLWQHDEDERLKNLYDEYRVENDCLARLTEAFDGSRTKNHIIKRMIQLGLIADRSEIVPKKTKKSRAKKQNSDESDMESERPQKTKSRKSTKPPKPSTKKTKKPKRPTKSPLDIGAVKFLMLQCQDTFSEALDWLKECINDAAADFEEDTSEDNDDGVPLLPLQSAEKDAMEDETFKNLLMALGIQPPIEGSDTYWKIPVYLNANDLKTRVLVLDGNLDVMPDAAERDGGGDENGNDDSDASQDTNEDTASSASDDSDNDDNDSANESDSNANFLSKRRQHFDNLVFNQSDNEDEHRAPLKPKKRRTAAAKKSTSDGKKSKGRGHSSKKLDINDVLMEVAGGSDNDEDDDGSRGTDNPDGNNALEDFDSENLRKRLAELVDNDDDEDDDDGMVNDGDVGNITSVNNASAKTPRRIRRNVIESDSSEDEMEINDTSNQTTRIDKRERTDNQSSINANNKVDKDIVDVTVDINNQSSTSLANSSGELGEVPSNSLRMSPTPEDEDDDGDEQDNVANINVDNNKRTRKESNAGLNGDDGDDEEEIVAKKKKLNESGAGGRRWATIIDEDSD